MQTSPRILHPATPGWWPKIRLYLYSNRFGDMIFVFLFSDTALAAVPLMY